jgi:hypothetical protein
MEMKVIQPKNQTAEKPEFRTEPCLICAYPITVPAAAINVCVPCPRCGFRRCEG